MAQDVSIAFRASDNLSNSVRQMQRNIDGLSRDVTEYRRIQDQTFNKKVEVKYEIEKAKRNLQELTKGVKENAAGSEQAFKEQQLALERLNEEYRRLTQVARDASRAERQLQDDISRSSNANTTRSAGIASDINARTSLLKSLAGAGLGDMLGQAVSGNLTSTISSMYGNTVGSLAGNMIGSVTGGAAMGSIAGPVGAAVGAAVGGLTGAINGLTEVQQKKDDAFRTEVQGIYNTVKQEQSSSLTAGIDLASSREQNLKGLSIMLGSDEEGQKMFDEIKEYGIATPYEANSLLDSARQMMAYGVDAKDVMSNTKMLGDVALGDQNKFNRLSYAYAQTQSAGKLTGQDLLQYVAAGFNPLKYLADEAGVSLEDMRDKMSDGDVSADDVTRAFKMATSEGERYFEGASQMMDTYAGKLAMLNDIKAEVDIGLGEGYTEEREKGIDKEIEQLDPDGPIGKKMREANKLIGQFQADLENQHQQAIIDATNNAMDTIEYKQAELSGDGAKMGEILAKARAEAEAEYKNSEGYRLQQEADLALVRSIQEDVALHNEYVEYGRKMGEAFSEGYLGVKRRTLQNPVISKDIVDQVKVEKEQPSLLNKIDNLFAKGNGYATGLQRVPADGTYFLHKGEGVETAVEANKKDNPKSSPIINITVNNNGRDMYEITNEICRQIIEASENFASVG